MKIPPSSPEVPTPMSNWWVDHPEPDRVKTLLDDVDRFMLMLQAGTRQSPEQFLAILQTAAELAAAATRDELAS